MKHYPKQYGTKTKTKGTRCTIQDGELTYEFTAGKPGRSKLDDDYAFYSGTVRFADGTEHNAFFLIDERSSGELGGMMVLTLDGKMTQQGNPDFLKDLKRTSGQVFPYKYRILGGMPCTDIHTVSQY